MCSEWNEDRIYIHLESNKSFGSVQDNTAYNFQIKLPQSHPFILKRGFRVALRSIIFPENLITNNPLNKRIFITLQELNSKNIHNEGYKENILNNTIKVLSLEEDLMKVDGVCCSYACDTDDLTWNDVDNELTDTLTIQVFNDSFELLTPTDLSSFSSVQLILKPIAYAYNQNVAD